MATTAGTGSYVQVQGGTLSRVDRPDGRVLAIPSEPFIVGRTPACGLPIDDPTVSWTHARLAATEHKGIHLRDLESRNGVFIEGVRIIEAYLQSTPARIRFGDAVYQFTPGGHVQLDVSVADGFGPLKGDSPVMRHLYATLGYIAERDNTVLITGETGTGKELIAKAIHDAGPRAHKPFVAVDCTSLPANLAESVLFGHERGSFTGATSKQISPFVEADGGTVFLDEIGELPPEQQAKLLRVLQERKIKPIGSNVYRDVDVRIIAATLIDLPCAINTRAFRSDLYFRLDQLQVVVPPLRDRPQDIRTLIHHFACEAGTPDLAERIPRESFEALERHPWPGNVRELQNLVMKATCFPEPGPVRIEKYISSSLLIVPPAALRPSSAAVDCVNPNVSQSDALRVYWAKMYEQYDGNISKIAFYSEKGRPTVRRNLLKYGLIGGGQD